MRNNQNNKFAMFAAVDNVLKGHLTSAQTIPALAGVIDDFDGLVDQIREKDRERAGKTSGKVAVKEDAEDAMVMATIVVAGALTAYAQSKGNAQLKKSAHIAETAFRHARAEEQINTAKMIYDLAKGNEQELVPFGVSASTLADLKARIAAYDSAVRAVASGMAERTGAATAVNDLFERADEMLKGQIDTLMQFFRISEPEFYNDYRAARVIKDLGGSHTTPGQPAAAPAGSPN